MFSLNLCKAHHRFEFPLNGVLIIDSNGNYNMVDRRFECNAYEICHIVCQFE